MVVLRFISQTRKEGLRFSGGPRRAKFSLATHDVAVGYFNRKHDRVPLFVSLKAAKIIAD